MLEIDRMTAPKRAIEKWGVGPQICQCMEECAELIQALNKYLRAEATVDQKEAEARVRKEMADVDIMLWQMVSIFGTYTEEWEAKVDRLERRLEDEPDE